MPYPRPMRWFTDAANEADDASWDAMLAAYQEHLARLLGSLPPDLAALGTDPRRNLHDARFHAIHVDREAETVEMVVVLLGGEALRLRFGDAAFIPDNLQLVAYAVGATFVTDHWGTTYTQIRASEVDVADDGRYVIRFRLWPFHEFGIAFRAFSMAAEQAPGDDRPPGSLLLAGDQVRPADAQPGDVPEH